MRIMNAMLGNGLGGIEFVFANYATALRAAGMDVVCCVAPDAAIKPSLDADMPVVELANRSQYDPRAIWRAAKLLREWKPDVLLVHGQRAYFIFYLALKLFGKKMPFMQVLHRPRFKNMKLIDHTITVSRELRERCIAHGMDASKVSYIPNFLTGAAGDAPVRAWHTPPVIGMLGRMVPEKGFDLFLDALAILKNRGIAFKARIGGDGALKDALHAQAAALGLSAHVEWLGWVSKPDGFYDAIDILCVPSRLESFGMVLLEAFARGKPVVSTATSGPSELIVSGQNGLLCAIDAQALADALEQALRNPAAAQQWAARALAENVRYSMATVALQIATCISDVREKFSACA